MAPPDLNLIRIENLTDPRLEPYANQSDAWLKARHNPDRVGGVDALTAAGRFMGEGTLVVDVIDNQSDELVWRGTATGVLARNPTPEERIESTDSAVQQLLSRFPPG